MPNDEHQTELQNKWMECRDISMEWNRFLSLRIKSHRKSAHRIRNLTRFLGGLNICFAAFSATAMFAALNKQLLNLSLWQQVAVTTVAVLPAISSGLQKEWQLEKRELGHVLMARDCGILLNELNFLCAMKNKDPDVALEEWHKRYSETISRPTTAHDKEPAL